MRSTDIEGSTQRWDRHPDAMRAALVRHDALLREAVEAHDGHVFKTVGDAFCAAFATAGAGVAAAIAAQRAVATEDWTAIGAGFPPIAVRMGLHTGEATACEWSTRATSQPLPAAFGPPSKALCAPTRARRSR